MIGIVESVKGASDIYAPLAGEIVEINEAVVKKPSLINKHPMTEGWLCKVRLSPDADPSSLLDEAGYSSYCRE